jgi:hypothetical protein
MEAERKVNTRLERIEALRRGEAPTRALLAELRGLLGDGEAWLGVVAARARSRAPAGSRKPESRPKEVPPKSETRALI